MHKGTCVYCCSRSRAFSGGIGVNSEKNITHLPICQGLLVVTIAAASTISLSTHFLAATTLAVAGFVSAVQASPQAFSAKAACQDTFIPMVDLFSKRTHQSQVLY